VDHTLYPEDLVQRRTTFIFDDTILSIVSENVCNYVVPKLKMDVLAVVYAISMWKRPVGSFLGFSLLPQTECARRTGKVRVSALAIKSRKIYFKKIRNLV